MSRRWGAVVVALAMAGLVSGCSGLDGLSTASSSSAPSSSVPSSSSGAAATSAGGRVTAPSTSSAAVVPLPSSRPVAAPLTYTGAGSGVLTIAKPAGASTVMVTIVGNASGKNFDVRAIDGAQDHLVATTSPYSGSTLLDAAGTTTHQLRVHAVGAWSLTLTDVRSAPSFTIGYRGTGDAVLLHVGPAGSGVVQAEGSGTPFTVRSYGAGRATVLASGTAPWSGTVRWAAGDAIVTVRASGPWSITVDHR